MKFDRCPSDDAGAASWHRRLFSQPPTDEVCQSLAEHLWELPYGQPLPAEFEGTHTRDDWSTCLASGYKENWRELPLDGPIDRHYVAFLAKWADGAYTKIQVGEKFAAALMATTANADALGGLNLPWAAFIIVVPGQLLGKYDRVRFMLRDHKHVQGAMAYLDVYSTQGGQVLTARGATLGEALFEGDLDDQVVDGLTPLDDADMRAIAMARRLVVGCVTQALFGGNVTQKSYAMPGKHERRGPPTHRMVTIGQPIDLDVRDEVRSYVAGTAPRRPMTVQTLVRGHYRNQAHGAGMTERKIIWIAPHWRGPEEAIIKRKDYVTQ